MRERLSNGKREKMENSQVQAVLPMTTDEPDSEEDEVGKEEEEEEEKKLTQRELEYPHHVKELGVEEGVESTSRLDPVVVSLLFLS